MTTILSYWITLRRSPNATAAHYRSYVSDNRRIGFIADKMLDVLDFKNGPSSVELAVILATGPDFMSELAQLDEGRDTVFHSGRPPLPDWVGPELWRQNILSDNHIHMIDSVPKETYLGPRIFRVERDTGGIGWLRIGIGIVPVRGIGNMHVVSRQGF